MERRRIRILRVITWLPVGGIERRLLAVLPRLDRARFDVSLVCIRERGSLADKLEAAGIPVDCIPFRRRWDLSALRRLAALMRDRRIDIVHSHMYRSNVPATVAARLAGVPCVWGQVHNIDTWETSRQARMDRFLCRWRRGMIAVSERVQADVMRTLRLPAERVPVIYNGVELERFAAARARRAEIRAREGVGASDVVFLFAARLVEQKRPSDFLEAFAWAERVWEGEGRLIAWILGEGPLNGELRHQAATLPDPSAVRFFGPRDDVEDYMSAADVFVLPSTKEGFSNALVEAMASGLPAIATDVGGNAVAVRDGMDGLILPPLAVDALTGAMIKLARDSELRAEFSRSAAEHAREFSLEKMVEQVQQFYERSVSPEARRLPGGSRD